MRVFVGFAEVTDGVNGLEGLKSETDDAGDGCCFAEAGCHERWRLSASTHVCSQLLDVVAISGRSGGQ